MFKVVSNPLFKAEVAVLMPVDGGHERQTFTAQYKLLDVKELDEANLATAEGQEAYLRKIFVGAEDLADEKGKPLPWSDAVRDQIINILPARQALIAGYQKALVEAREKN